MLPAIEWPADSFLIAASTSADSACPRPTQSQRAHQNTFEKAVGMLEFVLTESTPSPNPYVHPPQGAGAHQVNNH